MDKESPYSIDTSVKFEPLEVIDVAALVEACQDDWTNHSLSRVNDCVVRLGIVQGEFRWHHHDEEDEFFYVIEGRLLLDLENKTIELAPQQGFTVPKGVEHRTRAHERTVMLMIEGSAVRPTGD